jgi:hypothetical protein
LAALASRSSEYFYDQIIEITCIRGGGIDLSFKETLISILSIVGLSGIIVASVTYFLDKRKERNIRENELKEQRYKCTLMLMYAFLNPSELGRITEIRPDIRNIDDLKRELQAEWVHAWIFAGDDTIHALKDFLVTPNEQTFAKTVLSMRKELWNKGSKLSALEFSIQGFTK